MLTGNQSRFLETDGSVAWLHQWSQIHSPLHTMKQCYGRSPILYRGKIHFVDPSTRQIYPHAVVQNCSDRIKNLFQLDMDRKDSRYSLTPGILHQDKPTIFGPQVSKPIASHSFAGSQHAGLYTRNELQGFWESIHIKAASRTVTKKLFPKSYSINH